MVQELDAQAELVRQREYLERNLATIRAKLKKDSEIHRHENLRVLQDNTQLLQEINNLRRELKTSRTHAHSLETELGLRKRREPTRRKQGFYFSPYHYHQKFILETDRLEYNR